MISNALINIFIALSYVLAAQLGFFLAFLNTQVSPIWPPEGVAFAALALLGRKAIPGILIGAFAANLWNNPHLPTAILIAIGNTGSTLINLWILKKITGEVDPLANMKNLLVFLFFATIPGSIFSALIGVGSLFSFGFVPADGFWNVFFTWFAGEMQGFIIVAPFLLSIMKKVNYNVFSIGKTIEFSISLIIISQVAWYVFSVSDPLMFIPIPFMVFLAVRYRNIGTVFGALIFSTIAVYHAIHGVGPFADVTNRIKSLNNTLIFLDIYLFSKVTMSYCLVVILNERDEKNQSLISIQIDNNLDLEKKVKERTQIIEEQNQEFQYQIKMARSIQTYLLPEEIPEIQNFKIGYQYFPMMDVGGDFLDIQYFKNEEILNLFICDVSGHGVAAAFVATMMKMALTSWYDYPSDVVKASNMVHEIVAKKVDRHFVTATFTSIDLKSKVIRFAIAGHMPLLIVHKDGSKTELNPKGTVIFPYFTPNCDLGVYSIQEGDQIVLYTDGITEARNEKEDFFEIERLTKAIHKYRNIEPSLACQQIIQDTVEYSGGEYLVQDDLTILIVRA
jgi:serine phosphatase RsbU (regulator of sigma subunit)/integral membrane sensor domain MASE1